MAKRTKSPKKDDSFVKNERCNHIYSILVKDFKTFKKYYVCSGCGAEKEEISSHEETKGEL